jgi:lipoyl(octanoyl) transferase
LASTAQLDRLGVEVAPTDRGGDITYHGPGQLVAYPILDLNLLGLRLHEYMRTLEEAVIGVCAGFGVDAIRDTSATGVWIPDERGAPSRKIGAMGVRVKRWVSMHGLALNVSTDLTHFDLIVPCGLPGRPVTSLARELGDGAPSMAQVKSSLVAHLDRVFGARLSRGSSAPDPARR